MANSSCIARYKEEVIFALANDELIRSFIETDEENLIYTHIYPFEYIPETIEESKVYITMRVDIPEFKSYYNNGSKIWVYPRLIIWVIVPQDRMKIRLAGESATRMDEISMRIDELINGSDSYGYGELQLKSNEEGALDKKFRYRKMVFETKDVNDGLCN